MRGHNPFNLNFWVVGACVGLLACGPGGGVEEGSSSGGEGATSGGDASGETGAETGVPTATDATSATSGTTGPMMCTAPPLSEEQVGALAFGVFGNEFEAQPGDQRMLRLGVVECCYFLEEVDACVAYSLAPDDGSTYDPASGLLTIAADAEAGTVYTLTADVEEGRSIVEATVTVYTPESNPLVGVWHEVSQTACVGGGDVEPEPPIGELWFKANGDVLVTWMPFEVYVDYWGTYVHDAATGALELTIDGGNYVPPDVDGSGGFAVMGGELVLTDMWLGSAQGFMGEPACGHRFER